MCNGADLKVLLCENEPPTHIMLVVLGLSILSELCSSDRVKQDETQMSPSLSCFSLTMVQQRRMSVHVRELAPCILGKASLRSEDPTCLCYHSINHFSKDAAAECSWPCSLAERGGAGGETRLTKTDLVESANNESVTESERFPKPLIPVSLSPACGSAFTTPETLWYSQNENTFSPLGSATFVCFS